MPDSQDHDSEIAPRERERLERTFAALPQDVRTGLEIGFYDFRVTDRLREKMDLVSIDLPRAVHGHQGYRLAFAGIQALPFRDRAFDVVICTEVLEHLPEPVLVQGIKELERVSSKYVLVSAPYRQRVWNEMFKCSECGFVCNSMGHLQYMDEERLVRLFTATHPVRVEMIGNTDGYAPDWLSAIARRFGNVWHDYCFGKCPACAKTDRAVRPNILGFFLQRIIWRFQFAAKPRPAWVLILFKGN